MDTVRLNRGGMFFVYGYGGTSKTFVWKTLSAALRSKGEIMLNVASSGIASLLLPGGRTAHSRFAILLNLKEDSTCNIKQGSPLADLIIRNSLIIWDEPPIMNKYCFEALDRSMRDILRFSNLMSSELPFGGKVVVLEGDFRKILLVIPKGDETIGSSNDDNAVIDIPDDLLLNASDDLVALIMNSTFPNFTSNVNETEYLQGRAILAPTLNVVETVNEYMISLNVAKANTYLSSDTTCKSYYNVDLLQELHTPEFLNAIRCSVVPNHELKLKVGTPVMLLRNIDHFVGLYNALSWLSQ
ncbi:uncharacterized protein LOC127790890 [Diospyros lotus]|uniref:uncharacterized protein LOC127790890 n=1 Tax=Diospyros lotus TaxID=55363 RepID=UPI0022543031|nr:uncharacterized protein LOC127790890 [Diospyros lotus]